VFDGLPGEVLVSALDLAGVAASAGAACSRGASTASPVLEAMGDPSPAGGLRLSMGWSTTEDDVVALERRLPVVVDQARRLLAADADL
jgi:cysteine desulfurase